MNPYLIILHLSKKIVDLENTLLEVAGDLRISQKECQEHLDHLARLQKNHDTLLEECRSKSDKKITNKDPIICDSRKHIANTDDEDHEISPVYFIHTKGLPINDSFTIEAASARDAIRLFKHLRNDDYVATMLKNDLSSRERVYSQEIWVRYHADETWKRWIIVDLDPKDTSKGLEIQTLEGERKDEQSLFDAEE